ncbi:hypothetical protein SH611_09000 [Geminicoccaceae bacterium 1502E]|nr:hypothetical protein [Geminicoccaceae bacterium 1502E]
MQAEQTENVFRYRPLRLCYEAEPDDQKLAFMLRDSLQWRYDPRCALEVHFAREMYHCVRRQERLKIVEERCADRALTCPDSEARSVAEQARIWSQCRARAKRGYVEAKTELKALIEEREQLDALDAWPGLVRRRRERMQAGRAAAEARMSEPGHDPASDPDPGNAVFVDPAGAAFLKSIEEPNGGIAATERLLAAKDGDGTNEPETGAAAPDRPAPGGMNEPGGPAGAPAQGGTKAAAKTGTNEPERLRAGARSRDRPAGSGCGTDQKMER